MADSHNIILRRKEHGASIVAEFEAGLKQKLVPRAVLHEAKALPMTQEPFFTEIQEANTQDVDLNLSSLFNARSDLMQAAPHLLMQPAEN